MPSEEPQPRELQEKLGSNIAKLRKAKGLTQERLAEKIKVSARYLQSVEAGEYFPSLPKLTLLTRELKCSWDELFGGCK